MRPSPPLVAVLLLILLVLAGSSLSSAARVPQPSTPFAQPAGPRWDKVDGNLLAKVASIGASASIQFLLRLSDRPALDDVRFQRDEVVARLQATAETSRNEVARYLAANGVTVERSFWITNTLLVEGAANRIGEVAALPQVERILDNFVVQLSVEEPPSGPGDPEHARVTWSLDRVRAERAWSDFGAFGQGATVCVSDTGVDLAHPDLVGTMWSHVPGDPEHPGGWMEFDADGDPVPRSTPHDTHGHGTHTSGIVVGGDVGTSAIGVAPQAVLMHALVLPDGRGTFAQVIAGIEWCVHPYDAAGNPTGRGADIHSMSWSAPGYVEELVEPIRNSYYAGTLPVAAVGNCGEGCSGSPGNIYEAISVGASDELDAVASFSGGQIVPKSAWRSPPVDWPAEWTVPALVAPGVDVLSALPGGGYREWSGTSMAAPLVAGCAALLISANPSLTPEDMRSALTSTARRVAEDLAPSPNPRYGWGIVDCFSAVRLVAAEGGIRAVVRDQVDGQAVDQLRARATTAEVERQAETDSAGSFQVRLRPGSYTLTLERFGYVARSLPDITVPEGAWVDLEISMVPLPRGSITGSSIESITQLGVPGVTVTVLGVPVRLGATTDETGAFTISKVPEGTYDLAATSPYFRDATVAQVRVSAGADAQVFLSMEPRDWVAVVGDFDGTLSAFLTQEGYYVERLDWRQVIEEPRCFRNVVVNQASFPSAEALDDFIAATDARGTGVVFLDTQEHTWTGGGIYSLATYRSDPKYRGYGYDPYAQFTYYQVTQPHPVLGLHGPGDIIVFENSTERHEYAWFAVLRGANAAILAVTGTSSVALGPGIAVDERGTNRHVLLSLHGVSRYVQPKDWSRAASEILLNAVAWAEDTNCPEARIIDFGLTVTPSIGPSRTAFRATVQAQNLGRAAGDYIARLVVDGLPAGEQRTSLLPGEVREVAFDLARADPGRHAVSVGLHRADFEARPPTVTVGAMDLHGRPLGRATVSVVVGSSVVHIGRTDDRGALTFASPAVAFEDPWIVVRTDGTSTDGIPYLLARRVPGGDDVVVDFVPRPETTSVLDIRMTAAVERQMGVGYVKRVGMPSEFGGYPVRADSAVLVDRGVHVLHARATAAMSGGNWIYETAPRGLDLTEVMSGMFAFGGRMRPSIAWAQMETAVRLDWAIRDEFGNEILSLAEHRRTIDGSDDPVVQSPRFTLWSADGRPLGSAGVAWEHGPAYVAIPTGEIVAFVRTELSAGPYPFDGGLDLDAHVLSRGRLLLSGTVTRESSVQVAGRVHLSGNPVPATVTVNGVPAAVDASGFFGLTIALAEGANTILVTARDVAGGTSSEAFVVSSKRSIELSLVPLPEITNVRRIPVQGSVEGGTRLTVNGIRAVTDASGFFTSAVELSEGPNAIVLVAEDGLGNRREIVREVVLDTVPPEVEILAPSPGSVVTGPDVVVIGRTEPTVQVTVDGGPVPLEGEVFTVRVALRPGENHLLLEVRDPAGNVARTVLTYYAAPGVPPLEFLLLFATMVGVGVAIAVLRRMRRSPPQLNPA